GRQTAEDAQALPEIALRHEPRGIPPQMGPAARLPDGGARLRRPPVRLRQADRPGPGREAAEGLGPPTKAKRPPGRSGGRFDSQTPRAQAARSAVARKESLRPRRRPGA